MILFLLFLVLLVLGIVYFLKSKKNNEPNDKAKKTLLASLVFFVLFVIRCVSVDAFMMLGFIAFVLGIGYLVYCLFKKQPKKKALCMILAGFLVLHMQVVSVIQNQLNLHLKYLLQKKLEEKKVRESRSC